ncbi:MAG: Dihydrolipoyllysine-residue acetyltransferase component of pyruvate dehydrogenase complex [Anaerolineales bacterium]|nr:Dihydrolipoyllysine-residue acetyltransferase component of pyruvate dehydrogenase complex [Anaerolineales bacterium]
MPKMGYDMEEGKIVQWIKQEGDEVQKGDVIAEIETGKVNIEVEAFDAGVLRRILIGEGQTVPVGEAIAWITDASEELPDFAEDGRGAPAGAQAEEAPAEVPEPAPAEAEEEFPPVGGVKASPLARRVAQEHGVDVTQIEGTGPGGRITRTDVEAFIEEAEKAPPKPEAPERVEVAVPEVLPDVPAERMELTQLRKTVARRMTQSKTQAPHFYETISVDMGKAMALRKEINEYTQEHEDVKVSVNDLVVKAAAQVLSKYPRMNASFAGEEVVLHQQVNVGVAVATDEGLLTLVIPNTDGKSLSQISRETRDKVMRAREGKLRADDFETDGTFTVSNLGMYGIEEFIAIINPPEAAIMAVGVVNPSPVVRDGEVTVAQVMRVTVSGDHRVVDGADVAEFLAEFRRVLQNPMALVV